MVGGVIKKNIVTIINICMFLLLFVYNLLDQIIKNQNILLRIQYTVPFLIAAILCYVFRKKYKYNAYLFAVMSVFSIVFTSQPGILTGAVFLVFSLYIFQTKKTNIIIAGCAAVAIATKIFTGFSTIQVLNLIIGYAYCVGIYYILIHPKPDKVPSKIDDVSWRIIEMRINGLEIKEIADKIYLSTDAVNKRIKRMRHKFNCKNREQLIYKLSKLGYFKQETDGMKK